MHVYAQLRVTEFPPYSSPIVFATTFTESQPLSSLGGNRTRGGVGHDSERHPDGLSEDDRGWGNAVVGCHCDARGIVSGYRAIERCCPPCKREEGTMTGRAVGRP